MPLLRATTTIKKSRSSGHRVQRRMRLETLESRQMLAAEIVNPLHNYAMPMDVNEDGAVSAADALAVINSLHQGLVAPKSVPDQSLANLLRTDTNNDGQVSALDALLVINSLHSFSVSPSSQAASAESTATIFVTTTSDSGPGSLRQAILAANASTTDTTIGFAIPTTDLGYVDVDSTLAGGDANADVFRISPSSPLPEIQNVNGSAITIDGVSQTTFGGNTNPFGPEVELAGTAAGGSHGLSLRSSRVTVNGLAINGFSFDGISVRGSQATILGSYIGTDATGTLNRGNGDNGIRLHDTANTTTIGGATLDAANVISGNAGHGIGIAATNTFIYGNKIGTTADGSTALGNMRDGINSNNSTGITIGGPAIGERNVISANALAGVFLQLATTTDTTIVNNFIGTDGSGAVSLGTQGIGVRFENSVNLVVDNNLISGNTFAGIAGTNTDTLTVQRNRVGTSADGNSAVPNGVHGIEIFRGKNALIGGPNASDGNVVSGQSQVGIRALGLHDGLVVQNNFVGTNTNGDSAIANGSGISVDVTDSSNIVISRNLVSGNSGRAMTVFGAPLNEAIVELNHIGTNAAGSDVVANDSNGLFLQFTNNVNVRNNVLVGSKFSRGIEIDRSSDIRITGNNVGTALDGITAMPNAGHGIEVNQSNNVTIGGTTASDRNIVAFNDSDGVLLRGGTSSASVRGNSIFNNGGLGIDLQPTGRTANDVGDVDTGPNGLQNYPVLSVVDADGMLEMVGTLASTPDSVFDVDVYHNDVTIVDDAEGQTLQLSLVVNTNSTGQATFTIPRQPAGTTGFLTATATDAAGNTSEFSVGLRPLVKGPSIELSVDGQAITDGDMLSLGATQPSTPRQRTLLVRNTGTQDLVLQPLVAPAGFSILQNVSANQNVAPGRSIEVVLRFDASVEGTAFEPMTLLSNAGNSNLFLGGTAKTGLRLLKDLHPGLADSTPTDLIEFQGSLYFVADDGVHGEELWKTDGTTAGTMLVKDIEPGPEGSFPGELSVVNDLLVFPVYSEATGADMWRSDGTEAGTEIVFDMGPNGGAYFFAGSIPQRRETGADFIYFGGDDGSGTGFELWKTDGTSSGTSLVKDINEGLADSFPVSFHNFDGITYFYAGDEMSGKELWRTDGTDTGTFRVIDAQPGPASGGGGSIFTFSIPATSHNGLLFAQLNDGIHGRELWTSDGTEAGTRMVADLELGPAGSNPSFLSSIGSQLLFRATTVTSGNELWITDGTASGTRFVKDIKPGIESGLFTNVAQSLGDAVYLFADDGNSGREVWVSDGTEAGTRLALDLNPGPADSVHDSRGMNRLGSQLIFGGNDGATGVELWVLDLSTPDLTPPTSHVLPLASRADSRSIVVSVVGDDTASTNSLELVSGIAEYDLFVADGSGPFVQFATVPASSPTATFVGQSNHTYFFRSLARDAAGNVEAKSVVAETQVYVPDLDAPDSSVVNVSSATAEFQINVSGTDTGGSRIREFQVWVAIDDAASTQVAVLTPDATSTRDLFRASMTYHAIADGTPHRYRFFSIATDTSGNTELAPNTGDVTIADSIFSAPSRLSVTALDVQRGQTQRSYIRDIDLQFNTEVGLQSIVDSLGDADPNNNRVRLTRFAVDGSGPGIDVSVSGLASRHGSQLKIDFGAGGIGGNRTTNAADGYYRVSVDEDGDGNFDRDLFFYRLFGDANGDRIVDSLDVSAIAKAVATRSTDSNFDIDGSGNVDARDRLFAQRASLVPESTRRILDSLPLND